MIEASDPESLNGYLSADARHRLSDWVWGLSRWGKRPLVLAAFAVAEPALLSWKQGVPQDEKWQRVFARATIAEHAFAALKDWLRDTSEHTERALTTHHARLREHVASAARTAEESSGSRSVCERRNRCAGAGRVILAALDAALWNATAATDGLTDEAERQAIESTGPALETWTAVREYLACTPGTAESALRQVIRDAMLAPPLAPT